MFTIKIDGLSFSGGLNAAREFLKGRGFKVTTLKRNGTPCGVDAIRGNISVCSFDGATETREFGDVPVWAPNSNKGFILVKGVVRKWNIDVCWDRR